MIVGSHVLSGPDGIAQTSAKGNDLQVIPIGQGRPDADWVSTRFDGISDTALSGDDFQRIPVDHGQGFETGITAGPDGLLDCLNSQSCPQGDDNVVANTVDSGLDGILQSYADSPANCVPSIMTSDLLVPIPNAYTSDDLHQVRFHLKHP